MTPIRPEGHVHTADLLRIVDGEGDAALRERVMAHLAGCADCTAAYERLNASSDFVLDRLRVLDECAPANRLPATFAELAARDTRPPDARRVVDWRRVAGIALFLGAGALVAGPAAAWLARLVAAGQGSEAVTADQPSPETSPALPVDSTSARFSFSPASSQLRIEFAAAEPGAELVLLTDDVDAASFEVNATAALPPVLLLPNGVRIDNATSRGTQYALAIPRHVGVIVVSIPGAAAHHIRAEALPARIRLEEAR